MCSSSDGLGILKYGLLSICVLLFCLSSIQVIAGGVRWEILSPHEKQALSPYKAQWKSFTDNKQRALRRWASLSVDQQRSIRGKYQRWNTISVAKRQRLRKKLQQYKRIPLPQRRKLQRWHRWLKSLPKHEQQTLSRRWPTMGAQQRKNYIQILKQKYGTSW